MVSVELDILENKAVELIRTILAKGSITSLNARVDPTDKELAYVNGTFEDGEGRLSKFEVKFHIQQERAQVVSWYVSG